MNTLHFADNLIQLRKKRKVTQEELAAFIGVTKASVSKWETRQSLPDVLLLPQLASFFDVSIDELLGYAPQLSREQIQSYYYELAREFSRKPFEEVLIRCQELVKKYYSCYSFLFHIGVLWLNHYMLAESQTRQQEVLEEIIQLLEHILEECKEVTLCDNVIVLLSQIYLIQGKATEVIELLEETQNPYRMIGQSDGLLIQAYQLAGKSEQAAGYTQISMFIHLLSLVNSATHYLKLYQEDLSLCEETIYRIDTLSKLYQLDRLHANTVALFQLEAAVIYSLHGREAEALSRLEHYVLVIRWMLTEDHLAKHGDTYFNRISEWYEGCDLGAQAPREKSVILESALQGLNHPAFTSLQNKLPFQKLKHTLETLIPK